MRLEIRIGDWGVEWELGIGIGDWDCGLGIGIGIGDWRLGFGIGFRKLGLELEIGIETGIGFEDRNWD